MMKFFSESSVGVCWVQVDLTEEINLTAHLVIIVAIVKEWKRCILPDDHVATIKDNRGEIGIVQKKVVEEANSLHTGEHIFASFLDVTAMRLESILLVKSRTHNNSSHALVSSVESQLGNERATRNMCQSVAHCSGEHQLKKMSSSSEHKKKYGLVVRKRKIGKRGSAKKKSGKDI